MTNMRFLLILNLFMFCLVTICTSHTPDNPLVGNAPQPPPPPPPPSHVKQAQQHHEIKDNKPGKAAQPPPPPSPPQPQPAQEPPSPPLQHHPSDTLLKIPNEDESRRGAPLENIKDVIEMINKYYVTFTALVRSSSKDCYFYEAGGPFVITYEVLKGGSLDLGCYAEDDQNVLVEKIRPTQHGTIRVDVPPAKLHSIYRICLDNRKASHSNKQVYFEISLESEARRALMHAASSHLENDEETDFMPIENFISSVLTIDSNVQQILSHQHHFRGIEAVDRTIMEENFTNVNVWSGALIALIIVMAFLQSFFIRSLFFDRGTMHKLWSSTDRTFSWFLSPGHHSSGPVKRGA